MIAKDFEEVFSEQWVQINVRDETNELVILRKIIPWKKLVKRLSAFYHDTKGRIGTSLRLLVGLLILQRLRQLSDREVVKQVKENRFMQYFCNVPDQELACFINKTSPLTRFRQRLGIEGIAIIEEEVFGTLKWAGLIDRNNCLMDSSVQYANIIYPTDIQLLFKAIKKISDIARHYKKNYWWNQQLVKTRWKDYGREKKAVINEYLKEFFGYFIEALTGFQKIGSDWPEYARLSPLLELLKSQTELKLAGQQHIPNRIVSLDDVDARPIKKGKKYPKCEFGTTVQITFNRQGFMLSTENFIGQPSDTVLYQPTLKLLRGRIGRYPKRVITDQGYRSADNRKRKPKSVAELFMGKSTDVSEAEKDFCISARSATEGLIAVAKNWRGFRKSSYRNLTGHRIWTLLCQTAYNLKKFLQLYQDSDEEIPEKCLKKLGLLSIYNLKAIKGKSL